MKKLFGIMMSGALLLSMGFGLVACSSDDDPDPNPVDNSYTVTDSYGRKVTFEEAPEYIISLAPSNTEIAFYFGLGSKVIGISDSCNYPTEVSSIDVVSSYSGINQEKIMEKVGNNKSSAVILATVYQLDNLETLINAGYKIIILDAQSIDGVFDSFDVFNKTMGGVSGYESKLKALTDRVDAVKAAVAGNTTDVSVVHIVSTGFWVAGNNTVENSIIEMLGATNAAAVADGYYMINSEAFIAFNPTVMVYTTSMGSDWGVSDALNSNPYNQMYAVVNGNLYGIDGDLISRPGPRIVNALELYAEMLYPELFA